ncbi:DNA primase [Actinomyces lilanjuaniae]|uniref:DNA primase n=1 Tax=Actinomyces lilanjuaniae TaxID=2321394 RepID=A0ABN5PSY9_9ACTO|nr:DNA primase [Actinomyces lilanjuaniae]AYD89856.1 DNA primase [Actinomyces lilanjuaniae]
MTNDPRSALNRLIAAFEAHLDAAATGDEFSPAVVAAESTLQEAFFTYDDALFTAFGIELPFDAYDGDDDEQDDDDYDDLDSEDSEDEDYEEDDSENGTYDDDLDDYGEEDLETQSEV